LFVVGQEAPPPDELLTIHTRLPWADPRNFLFNFKYSAGIWNMDRKGMSVCRELDAKLNDGHGMKSKNGMMAQRGIRESILSRVWNGIYSGMPIGTSRVLPDFALSWASSINSTTF